MAGTSLSNLFYRRPRLLVLTCLMIATAGLTSLQIIPRAEDPELTNRFASIFIAYPGASAARVESQVTDVIEEELRKVEEIAEINTSSRSSIATFVIDLEDAVGKDTVDEVWSRVRDRLDDATTRLPAGVQAPQFEEFSNAAWTRLLALEWQLDTPPDLALLSRLAEELADRLREVNGTEEVKLYGEAQEEVLVEIDPTRLASTGLDVPELARRLAALDAKLPAGQVRGARNQLLVEVSGELDNLARIRNLPVRQGADGRFLRLDDVASVRKGVRQPAETMSLIHGQAAVVVAARMRAEQRIDTWSARLQGTLDRFRADLPLGVGCTSVFDQSIYTEERLSALFGNFAAAAGLVMLVILFTMGWRSAILVGSALPLTTLMVLQGLNSLGIPINQMSVTGLIIALGLLIDNAIVIVDEVRHRLSAGLHAGEAVAAAVQTLFVPLLGSTVTTVFAFLPIWLMPGPAGEFVGGIAKSVVLAVGSSFFLAMTLVPALAGILDRWGKGLDRGPRWLSQGLSSARMSAIYSRTLGWLMQHRLAALALGALLPSLGMLAATRLDEQFFPPADRDQFAIDLRLPWQAGIAQTRELSLQIRAEMLQHPQIEAVHWFLGESAPKFYYNSIESRRSVDFYAEGLVQMTQAEGGRDVIRGLQAKLDAQFPQAQVLLRQLEQGPPFDAPIELRIFGPDLAELRRIGDELRSRLAGIAGVTHTRATLEGGQPKLLLRLDEERARRAGFDNAELAGLLQARLEGSLGGSLLEATEELPLRVRLRDTTRAEVDRVHGMDLARGATWASLANFTEPQLVADDAVIPHRQGQRLNTVQGFLQAGMLPEPALRELQGQLAEEGFTLPSGYRLELGGEAAERDEAVGKLMATAFLLMVGMLASLVLALNSFRRAGIIASVALLSVGLSTLALWISGYPFGFMAIVGTMGLVGVAVNDSIVVLTGLCNDPAACSGNRQATVRVLVRATRHLVSTSLTTAVGFLPLMLAGGGFWPPVAVAIGGGVCGATLLAVTVVPALFLALQRKRAA